MTQSKKRKQSPTSIDDHCGDHDQNIDSVLFDEMTIVNNQLFSIKNNIKLVDNLYFAKNNGMIDEFIGNIKEFVQQLETHRKKVRFANVNSDILMNVYQFLGMKTLINCCRLVCKLWKESLMRLNVRIKPNNAANLLSSSLAQHVVQLKLIDVTAVKSEPLSKCRSLNHLLFASLSYCTNLNQLKILDLSNYNLDMECVEYLKKCNMPNLTELKLNKAKIDENTAIELMNSEFMSNIRKLDLSNAIEDFSNNFYESVSESKYLNQITDLKIENEEFQYEKRIDLFVKSTINLEHLHIQCYEFPNLLINGDYRNLKHLEILWCEIKNQDFANLIVSPNLPKLETLKARGCSADEIDNPIAVFPPNSQSSITELDLREFNTVPFPSLFDHCPKLKKLLLEPQSGAETKKVLLNMMKSPGLSNLKVLRLVNGWSEIVEEVFSNPVYSNLNELYLQTKDFLNNITCISNCTTLVNLTTLDLSKVSVFPQYLIEECSTVITINPTFSKLKHYVKLEWAGMY